MKDPRIGLRVELSEDIQMQKKGERGLVGEKAGYIGCVFDCLPGELFITHAGYPMTNFVCVIEDERQPELQQMRLF